jgi:DNA polymerase V
MQVTTLYPFTPFSECLIPFYTETVAAGFPSPADGYIEATLDLNKYLIQHPAATFLVRVSGDSMIQAGIDDGDLLIVDRALEPHHNKIVVAVVNGELTVKRLCFTEGRPYLWPENPNYPPIAIREDMGCQIWGVVTTSIRHF